MIQVDRVSKAYGRVSALKDVSFQVNQGEIVGLLGPNGAGKTTLLKVLTGFFEPTGGTVRIGEMDVVENPVEARRQIGYLPENAPLYPEMLVQESLLITAELRGIPPVERQALLRRAILAAGLESVLTRPIGKLSKGFHQRVGLAQAILHRPNLLILDEPTNGLDPDQIGEVRKLIRQLARQSTVILSTHILSEVEQTCERVLVLLNGRLRADARLADLTAGNRFRVAMGEMPGRRTSGAKAEAVCKPSADAVRQTLLGVAGVRSVKIEDDQTESLNLSVEGDPEVDLGAMLFELAKKNHWPLRELHPTHRTLESVFRAITSGREVEL